MQLNITYDSSVTAGNFSGGASEEAAFKYAIGYVANLFDTLLTNPVTVNITIGYGEANGTALPANNLGESVTEINGYGYSDVVSALQTVDHSANQLAAYQLLPATDPTGGGTFLVSNAQAKAIGLIPSDNSTDGRVGFSATAPLNFAITGQAQAGEYDLVGIAEHEITEVLGRISTDGQALVGFPQTYTAMDLFRYSAPGVRQLTTGAASYFSIDGGVTNLDNWNNSATGNHGDLGDWAPSAGNDSFLDQSAAGVVNALTLTDLTNMNMIGWDISVPSNTVPNGIADYVGITVGSNGNPVASVGVTVLSGGSQQVFSRGIATATMLGGGTQTVAWGGTARGTVIGSGAFETVSGLALAAIVDSGGLQMVASGGIASGATIAGGGIEYVGAGGTSLAAMVAGGGIESDFGIASGATIVAGGIESVGIGGTAFATRIQSGGAQDVFGTAISATVNSGGSAIVSSGIASATLLSGGGAMIVLAGGTSLDTVVSGTEIVSSGGTAGNTVVTSGGTLVAAAGGIVSGLTLESGATLTVFGASTDLVIGATVGGDGVQPLSAGATTPGLVVNPGATLEFFGALPGGVVGAGVTLVIGPGGTASGTVVRSGGVAVVYGQASASTISGTGQVYVQPGGAASFTIIGSGGDEFVETDGVTTGTLAIGGSQIVYGTASGTVLTNSAYLYLESGTTFGAAISNGVEIVYSTASDTTVGRDGFDFVFSGGIANGTTLSGGAEYVESGATASGTVADGGAQIVYGLATDTVLNGAAVLYVEPGGIANGIAVTDAIAVIYGSASGTTIAGDGADYIGSGGAATGTVVTGVIAVEFVEIGGTARGTLVEGGTQAVYGVADGTRLNSSGFLYVEPGGSASGTFVTNAIAAIYGSASATYVTSLGSDFVESGGEAIASQISGGVEFVEAGGIASGTVVGGGAQVVYGTARDTILDGGGFQYVSAGGIARDTVVNSGGYEYVVAGGIVSGAAIGGGTLEVASGGVDGGAAITFASDAGGTLRLDGSAEFSGTVAGFGLANQIDLADIAFGPGTMLGFAEAGGNSSGILMVTDGTATATMTLLGQYAAAQFAIAGDSHGGTLVTDLPGTITDSASTALAIPHPA